MLLIDMEKNRVLGKWQVLVADLTWKDSKCPSPAGCPGIDTKKDVFDLLYNK